MTTRTGATPGGISFGCVCADYLPLHVDKAQEEGRRRRGSPAEGAKLHERRAEVGADGEALGAAAHAKGVWLLREGVHEVRLARAQPAAHGDQVDRARGGVAQYVRALVVDGQCEAPAAVAPVLLLQA